MSESETMVLYNKLFSQEKRAVNRLLRALASGKVEKAELSKVCRLISKAAASKEPAEKALVISYITRKIIWLKEKRHRMLHWETLLKLSVDSGRHYRLQKGSNSSWPPRRLKPPNEAEHWVTP